MGINIEYKKAKIIDFCIIQIEETKEVIEVEICTNLFQKLKKNII